MTGMNDVTVCENIVYGSAHIFRQWNGIGYCESVFTIV